MTISEVSVIRLSSGVRLPSSLYWRYLIRPGWLVAVVGPVDDRARLYQGCIYWQEGGGGEIFVIFFVGRFSISVTEDSTGCSDFFTVFSLP